MRLNSLSAILAILFLLSASNGLSAEELSFNTAVGTVEKFEKETLTILTSERSKRSIEFKITGTTKFHLLAPQVRNGKTVATQRSAETSDLINGQSIALIYTVVEKENVLLTAVIKAGEKK